MEPQTLRCLCWLIFIKAVSSYIDVMPKVPSAVRASFFIPDEAEVRFYPVSKRGGPIMEPLLPWRPQEGKDVNKKNFYFNVESEHGVLYRLKLKRNTHLFSKDVMSSLTGHDAVCLFSGHIAGDRKSGVGINLCNGMGSILSSTDGEFLLKPMNKDEIHKHEWKMLMQKAPSETTHSDEGRAKLDDVSSVTPPPTRRKRSAHTSKITRKRNIEILVVADSKMVQKYGTEEATTYILTVMNMVSSLFKDKSLGVDINIVLAGLMFLKGNERGLEIGHKADVTLSNFCQWQASLKDHIHHDHAILMTGLDICVNRNAPCDTIGYAPIRGMCSRTRSCTVNEDRGLGVAFTIAHEIGHNLGMVHDGTLNNCTENGSIMGPSLTTDTGTFFWSKCNQRQIDEFLDSEQADCLLRDAPVKSSMYNMTISELPGQVYSGDQQCKHLYGHQASVCQFDLPDGANICRYMWCYVGGMRCETKFLPAAEGTPCDANKWCRKGECIPINKDTPEAIDGSWNEWTNWTECTRTCGGGVRTRLRYCTNPSPRYGGKYCEGDSKEYSRCNTEECDSDERAFRAMQCSNYNNQPFKRRYFKWDAIDNRYLSSVDRCKLFCRARRYNFFFQMNDKVIDGTKCDDDSDDICINGKCEPVGCDGKIWSDAVSDKCGVCNGDGSTCETIRGLFTEQVASNNYTTFLTIPAGSTNINIKELRSTSSFIAVKLKDGDYYLNGQWSMDWSGKFNFAGAKFVYNRLYSGLEMLYTKGPTNETLEIQILAIGSNPGVQYEYIVPINESVVRYTWRVSKTSCNEECGGGNYEQTAVCKSQDGVEVADDKCIATDKPMTGKLTCNMQPCLPRWVPQSWSRCSRSCGGGKQKRRIYCMQKFSSDRDKRVRNRHCKGVKPPKSRICNRQECVPKWSTGAWGVCSVTCGDGIQTRSVYCRSTGKKKKVLSDRACSKQEKPDESRSCTMKRCDVTWRLSEWGECSVSCGFGGTQSRQLMCVSNKPDELGNTEVDTELCVHISRPSHELFRECVLEAECPIWQTGAWSECSTTCGESERRRQVTCLTKQGDPSNGCDEKDRPSNWQKCYLEKCPVPTTITSTTTSTTTTTLSPTTIAERDKTESSCQDTKSWCSSLAVYRYYCMRRYYRTVCCSTCSG